MATQVIIARTHESMNASSLGEPSRQLGTRVYREERLRLLRRKKVQVRELESGVPNGKPFPVLRKILADSSIA
jgi:hypothetical protein